jgi:hypothetical protein
MNNELYLPGHQELDGAIEPASMIESEFCDNCKGKNRQRFFTAYQHQQAVLAPVSLCHTDTAWTQKSS